MGLLDSLNTDQGMLGLMLMQAGQAKPVRTGLGEGLLQALQGVQANRSAQEDRSQRTQMQQMQMQQMQGALGMQQDQMAQHKRQQEQEAQFRALIQSPQAAASSAALAGGGGPTPGNANSMQPVDPMQQMQFEAMRLGQIKPMDYINSQRKDTTPMKLGAGEALVDPRTFKPLFTNPKEDTTPGDWKLYQLSGAAQRGMTFDQWDQARKRAGATNVRVSMDKGFGEAFAKDAAGFLSKSRDKAQGAANTLRTLDQIDSAVSSGNVITGPAATPQLVLNQIGQALNVTGKDGAEKLANTRTLMQGAASLAVDGAAALAGQGQITDSERKLVDRMAGGNIDQMTVPEIRATMAVLRKVNTGRIAEHRGALQKVGPEFGKFAPLYQVDAPTQTSGGVDDLVRKYTGGR